MCRHKAIKYHSKQQERKRRNKTWFVFHLNLDFSLTSCVAFTHKLTFKVYTVRLDFIYLVLVALTFYFV